MDFREYDNAIGRFNCIDALAELDYSNSPYVFSSNDPVYFSDPSGLRCRYLNSDDHTWLGGILHKIGGWFSGFESSGDGGDSSSDGDSDSSSGGGASDFSSFLHSLSGGGGSDSSGSLSDSSSSDSAHRVGVGGGMSDPPGKAKQSPFMKKLYNSWFCENQYFNEEEGLKVGRYIDFTPFRSLLGIRLGEYRQSSSTGEYYNNNFHLSQSDNHFFEVGFNVGIGANWKYNIGENRVESWSVSYCGFSAEYSVQSSYQSQWYLGFDGGISLGLGIGGYAGIRGGWKF